MENHKPVTKDWLLELGMKDMGEGILKSDAAGLAVRLQEFSEELGQLLDFYLYSPSKLVNVYSAYYIDRNDFLTDDIHQHISWRQQNVSQ